MIGRLIERIRILVERLAVFTSAHLRPEQAREDRTAIAWEDGETCRQK